MLKPAPPAKTSCYLFNFFFLNQTIWVKADKLFQAPAEDEMKRKHRWPVGTEASLAVRSLTQSYPAIDLTDRKTEAANKLS